MRRKHQESKTILWKRLWLEVTQLSCLPPSHYESAFSSAPSRPFQTPSHDLHGRCRLSHSETVIHSLHVRTNPGSSARAYSVKPATVHSKKCSEQQFRQSRPRVALIGGKTLSVDSLIDHMFTLCASLEHVNWNSLFRWNNRLCVAPTTSSLRDPNLHCHGATALRTHRNWEVQLPRPAKTQ